MRGGATHQVVVENCRCKYYVPGLLRLHFHARPENSKMGDKYTKRVFYDTTRSAETVVEHPFHLVQPVVCKQTRLTVIDNSKFYLPTASSFISFR